MLKRINACLNNESGGPNLEQIMGIGISIAIMCAIYYFAARAYHWCSTTSKIVERYKE